MSFLNKLFNLGKDTENKSEYKGPDNTRLLFLLKNYSENSSYENYKVVIEELMNGNSFLLLASDNSRKDTNGWVTLKEKTTIGLTSVVNLDGLKAVAAFTDKNALIEWTKRKTHYTAFRAQDVLKICQENKFDRIVINSGQDNMFVLQRDKNTTEHVIDKGTEIMMGPPGNPLSKNLINFFTNGFNKLGTIDEAYQYVQTANNEASLVIAVKMNLISDNSKTALINTLNDAFTIEKTELPVDLMFIEEHQLGPIRSITNSLFYKKANTFSK